MRDHPFPKKTRSPLDVMQRPGQIDDGPAVGPPVLVRLFDGNVAGFESDHLRREQMPDLMPRNPHDVGPQMGLDRVRPGRERKHRANTPGFKAAAIAFQGKLAAQNSTLRQRVSNLSAMTLTCSPVNTPVRLPMIAPNCPGLTA